MRCIFLQLQDMTRLGRGELHQPRHRQGAGPFRAAPRAGQRRRQRAAARKARQQEREEKPSRRGNQDALSNYCVNLNKKATAGKIDPLIGREMEIERTIQILCRRTKNNPLYVGDPAWARRRSRKAWPSASSKATCRKCWSKSTIFALDMGALLAGTRYRGRFRGAAEGGGDRAGEPARARSCSSTRSTP